MPVRAETIADGHARVEFRLPPEVAAGRAWVAGEFNDWSTDALPMKPEADGSLVAEIEVPSGRSYRFRYYLGDGRWENDWSADAYVDNEHGGSDSVVVVPAANHDGNHGG
jgi:1,4-alpha-glucan branching enzyme